MINFMANNLISWTDEVQFCIIINIVYTLFVTTLFSFNELATHITFGINVYYEEFSMHLSTNRDIRQVPEKEAVL